MAGDEPRASKRDPGVISTLLLVALPASGKSELRRYLANLPADRVAADFGLGPTAQLDDYPYVHLMRRISEEMMAVGVDPAFFRSAAEPFLYPHDWGTLIQLLNEDFAALGGFGHEVAEPAAAWLAKRLDRARDAEGLPGVFTGIGEQLRTAVERRIEPGAARLRADLNATLVQPTRSPTVLIEFARGGPAGTRPPIDPPRGYSYSFSRLSAEILARAAVLYVWVTPEESRRRNNERARPGRGGDASILHHGVPERVLTEDYGMDDFRWLLEQSDAPGTISVETAEGVLHLPAAVFDNRDDKTSFLRANPAEWPAAAVAALHTELRDVFTELRA